MIIFIYKFFVCVLGFWLFDGFFRYNVTDAGSVIIYQIFLKRTSLFPKIILLIGLTVSVKPSDFLNKIWGWVLGACLKKIAIEGGFGGGGGGEGNLRRQERIIGSIKS